MRTSSRRETPGGSPRAATPSAAQRHTAAAISRLFGFTPPARNSAVGVAATTTPTVRSRNRGASHAQAIAAASNAANTTAPSRRMA
jgi:hypothetical protein